MAGILGLQEKWANLKLQSKLILTFIFIILTVTVVMTTIVGLSTKVFFDAFVRQHNEMRSQELKRYFADYYYSNDKSWDGIQKILLEPPRQQSRTFNRGSGNIDRIILTGPDGLVIADSKDGQTIGQTVPNLENQITEEIHESGNLVGKMILGVNPPRGMLTLEPRFSKSVTYAIAVAGVIAILLAIGLALQFSRRISIPVVSLTKAAEKLAGKDFKYRLFIPARDEIGSLARAFNSMADAIEENEQIRNHLVADVAHELRTPVTIIRGTLESLQAGVMEPSEEVIVSLHDEILRLSRLITDLQDISLAESGNMLLKLQDTEPVEILDRMVSNFRGHALSNNIELRSNVSEITGRISVDGDRIIQALSNILTNAIRHTPPGGKIELSLTENEEAVMFLVADTGPGIHNEDLPHIFDRFYRGSQSRNRIDGGSGLGLAIAKSLVAIHGGNITVDCPPDGGSVFTISLPKVNEETV